MSNFDLYDVVVVGAGPSGIQSILSLQGLGLRVALLDDNSCLGGQIYKNVEQNAQNNTLFDKEYLRGLSFIKQVNFDEITYINEASVWSIGTDLSIYYSRDKISYKIQTKKIIIATGSMERPFAIKGWTLPGVLGVSAAQIALKESLIIKNDAVFIGSGPLFYYVISQYIDAGAKIKAIVDTTPLSNYFKASKYIFQALMKIKVLFKGLRFLWKFKKNNIKIYRNIENIELDGDDELKRVVLDDIKIETKTAFIHNGLAPNINLQLQAGCDYVFNHMTRTIDIETDKYMQTSLKNLFVIGDGKSVRGVDVAVCEAKIATLKILEEFKKIGKNSFHANFIKYSSELKSYMHLRNFLDTLYLPSANFLSPIDNDVVICRCEEVTLGEIKDSLSIDCRGPNSVKSFTRCGMGNCQGRFCGLTLLESISKETNVSIDELKYLRIRSPIKPISIKEMAKLA